MEIDGRLTHCCCDTVRQVIGVWVLNNGESAAATDLLGAVAELAVEVQS